MRKANLQEITATSETVEGESEEVVLKESRFDNMLNYLRDYEQDFTVTIYKKKERNKRAIVAKFDNYLPDPIEDLQVKYGGGEFRIMVHSGGGLIDCADIAIEPPEAVPSLSSNPGAVSRKEVIEEIRAMADIIGGKGEDGGNKDVLLKILDIQNQISERFMKQQLESEKRMTEMILSLQSKKPALGEILEVIQFVDEIKGDRAAPENFVEGLLKNPLAQPFIKMLTEKVGNVGEPVSEPKKIEAKKPSIEDYIYSLPEEFVEKITAENSEHYIKELHEKNKDRITIAEAQAIVNEILNRKSK